MEPEVNLENLFKQMLIYLTKSSPDDWKKLLHNNVIMTDNTDNNWKVLRSLDKFQSTVRDYIECKQVEAEKFDANIINQEIQEIGYTWRNIDNEAIVDPRFGYIWLPLNLLVLEIEYNKITEDDKNFFNGDNEIIAIVANEQPAWVHELSLFIPGDTFKCKSWHCNKLNYTPTESNFICQAKIWLYWRYHELKINQKYLIITSGGDLYHCYYKSEGFYNQDKLLIGKESMTVKHNSEYRLTPNPMIIIGDGEPMWIRKDSSQISYCVISDPAVR